MSSAAARCVPVYLNDIIAKKETTPSRKRALDTSTTPNEDLQDAKRHRFQKLTRQDLLGPQGTKRLESYLVQTCGIPRMECVECDIYLPGVHAR